jgi:hypothetical protein
VSPEPRPIVKIKMDKGARLREGRHIMNLSDPVRPGVSIISALLRAHMKIAVVASWSLGVFEIFVSFALTATNPTSRRYTRRTVIGTWTTTSESSNRIQRADLSEECAPVVGQVPLIGRTGRPPGTEPRKRPPDRLRFGKTDLQVCAPLPGGRPFRPDRPAIPVKTPRGSASWSTASIWN